MKPCNTTQNGEGPIVGAALALLLGLAACGGGANDTAAAVSPAAACDVATQNDWLRGYMDDWYLWSDASAIPEPAGYDSVQAYFEAWRYPGDAVVPRDRWSYIESTAAYTQFFGEGKTLGYGLFVNGIELTLPLKVRYVEPLSPAAAAGIRRGDTIVALNGRPADDIVAHDDFSVLSPAHEGDVLQVELGGGAVTTSVRLQAVTYDLQPVSVAKVLDMPNGAKAGYLVLKDFITQAEAPLADAFRQFRAAGATELIIDLRYNGGGRVSTSSALASLVSGAAQAGQVFAELRYNAKHAGAISRFTLSSAPGPAYPRIVVLTGARTCSASELVVNGLKPFAEVITVGGTTCGKPFGFNPTASCGNTFSAVNFESVNALGQGRYYSGIAPTCAVADDFSGQLGDPAERLTAAAAGYLQTGACPAGSATTVAPRGARSRAAAEPGDRRGMWAD